MIIILTQMKQKASLFLNMSPCCSSWQFTQLFVVLDIEILYFSGTKTPRQVSSLSLLPAMSSFLEERWDFTAGVAHVTSDSFHHRSERWDY